MSGMYRIILIFIIAATIYGPVELTRVIIAWGLAPEFIFEIIFMWSFYIGAMTLVARVLKLRCRHYEN